MSVHARPRVVAALAALVLLADLVAVAGGVGDRSSDPFASLRVIAEAQEEAAELEAPLDAMLARQLFGSDVTPPDALAAASAEAAAIRTRTARSHPQVAKPRWELVGPTNIGGRVLDVVVDPELTDTIYIAAASGGVWRSNDAGRTFEQAWPIELPQAIGALAIDSQGVLYAGTGETGPGGGSMTYGGNGVYRSTDRGETWEHLGLDGTSRIGRIAIDPTDDATVLVAASGNLFRDSEERGLYRSTDAGRSWELVLPGENLSTGAADVAIDTEDPDHILATMWDHRREPDIRRYNGVGSGLFVSRDGGDTWSRVPGFGPNRALGRIGVAFAPSDPDVVYTTASGESGLYAGAFKSIDGGRSWIPIAHEGVVANNFVFGWWFGRIYVDPEDPDHVFQHGLYLAESEDGGITWTDILTSADVHADQHGMAWDPKVPDRVYLGNDGGVYRSDDNGEEWTFGEFQPWSQLYGLDVGQSDPRRLVAGLQDNGANRSFDEEGNPGGPGDWNRYGGGDGERTLIKPGEENVVYGCSQYGSCFVSHDWGERRDFYDDELDSTRFNWFTPIELDPDALSTVYTAGEKVHRSLDDAGTWTTISGDLSNGLGRETNPLFINFGTVTTLSPANDGKDGVDDDGGTVYAGTDDGNLWFTHDGGTTWTQADDPDLPDPKRWVTRVQADPADPMTAYVTFSGFRNGDDTSYLFRTTDGGATWTDVTGDLPDAPLNDVNVIGDLLVVASDVGVFLSQDGGASWLALGSGLPNVPVHELRWHGPTRSLYVATFGRSAWEVELPKPLLKGAR